MASEALRTPCGPHGKWRSCRCRWRTRNREATPETETNQRFRPQLHQPLRGGANHLAQESGVGSPERRRCNAIEPVIGHMKSDGHLGRNFLLGPEGDQANLILAATGHNLRLLRAWLAWLLAFCSAC